MDKGVRQSNSFQSKIWSFQTSNVFFVITESVKQSRVGTHLKPAEFLAYPEDEKLCVIKHLQEYIKKTQVVRGDCSQLLLSHVKPHGLASKDTISRWCKNVLKFAGIDVSKFTAHSTRSASTSFLTERNVNIKDIMTSAGWSNEMTFQRYYHKPADNTFNFGDTILQLADSDNWSLFSLTCSLMSILLWMLHCHVVLHKYNFLKMTNKSSLSLSGSFVWPSIPMMPLWLL